MCLPGSQAGDRNRQPKRAKRPHSKFSDRKALDGPAMRPKTPLAVENGVGKLAAEVRQMSARERERGELPSPICPCLTARLSRGFFFRAGRKGNGHKKAQKAQKGEKGWMSAFMVKGMLNQDCIAAQFFSMLYGWLLKSRSFGEASSAGGFLLRFGQKVPYLFIGFGPAIRRIAVRVVHGVPPEFQL